MQILADDLYVHGNSLYRTEPHGYNHLWIVVSFVF